jgi:DNA-binding NtrC family response regulator
MKSKNSKVRHNPAYKTLLLSFIGSRDPFSGKPGGGMSDGPVLSLLSAREGLDRVILFHTPEIAEQAAETARIIRERHGIQAETRKLKIADPTSHAEIMRVLRTQWAEISAGEAHLETSISISSGTSQMHACWFLLAASGEIPGTILQVREGRFVTHKQPLITTIDPRGREMPRILAKKFSLEEIPDIPSGELDRARLDAGIVGDHPLLLDALKKAARASRYDLPVLILGESGTGKDLLARFIHGVSRRRANNFIPVNCAALTETLTESELFGYKKGAFTGAAADKKGAFDTAAGGTLFLDEVGDASPTLQSKLLRAIETREITPVGGGKPQPVDVRITAATNQDLQILIQKGRFREDLYHRLSAITILLPHLNERRSDIPVIALHLLDQFNKHESKAKHITSRALQALQSHDWQGGNVRALKNVITRAAVMAAGETIDASDLEFAHRAPGTEDFCPDMVDGFALDEFLNAMRIRCYRKALADTHGRQSEAARRLGVTPQAVSNFIKDNSDLAT